MLLKQELEHATGIDTSELPAAKDFITLKAEVDKLDITKLVNVPSSQNNLKTKVDDLDVINLKGISVDLKKLSDVVENKVVKKYKIQHTKYIIKQLRKENS